MAQTNPLARFPLAPSLATPRLLIASSGDVGTGKTRFALSGPAPVVVFSFDQGTEGVVEEFREETDKEIRVINYDWSPTDEDDFNKQMAVDLRDRFIEDYKLACAHARTVIWDTETKVWNLFRYAEFGSPKADVPRDFDKVNMKMQRYLQLPKKLTINFVAIQALKDEWGGATKKTGGKIRAGFAETPGLMHIELFHEREKGKFYTTVLKVRGKKSNTQGLSDTRFENFDMPTLGMMLFPDASDESWS